MFSRFIDSGYFDFIYVTLLISSVALGYSIARYRYLKKQRVWKISGIENGIIGFYGLLLSFILIQSGNSNKDRTNLIHHHSDALATIHRESLSMPDSIRMSMHGDLIKILEFNLRASHAGAGEFQAFYSETGDVYNNVWTNLARNKQENSLLKSTMDFTTEQMHRATALNYRILYSHQDRTPLEIMALLVLGSWIVGLLVGFTNGFNEELHVLVPIIFIMLAGLTLLSIRDLDNPASGMIKPSYKNYRNLLNDIRGFDVK